MDLKQVPPISRRNVLSGLPMAWAASQVSVSAANAANGNQPSLGNLFPVVESYAKTVQPGYSFLEKRWIDLEKWKQLARATYRELLRYNPVPCDFAARTIATHQKNGYRQEKLIFQSAPSVFVPGMLLIPDRQRKNRPAVVLLHDHGGFYYFGKEKMLQNDHEPSIFTAFCQKLYPSGPIGTILAQAGYVVLTIDAFYFGGRRLDPATLPSEKAVSVAALPAGSDEGIRASNQLSGAYESLVAKTLFMSGTTWPGILLWDDLRSVDYLLTRPEVNRDRIGCFGLSLGGFRAAHLAAFHPKIRSSIICCFMSTFPSMLRRDVEHHTWMAYVPGGAEVMDLPDVASLAAPNSLLVQYGLQDPLFPLDGKQASAKKIKSVFEKAGVPDRMEARFYEAPHMVSREMNTDLSAWFEKTLV
jgi:dienelactone hydrolase